MHWSKQSLENISFSMIKTFVALFALLCLFSLSGSIWSNDAGIVILPFQTPTNQGYDGLALSDQLTHELIRIKEIHRIGIGESDHFGMYGSGLESMRDYTNSTIKPLSVTLQYSLSHVGMLGQSPISFSIGDIFLSLKRLLPLAEPPTTLSSSLQVYDTKVVLAACLANDSPIRTWLVISKGDSSLDEIPRLVQDLAYQIAHDLSLRESGSTGTWQAFANITQGLEAYQTYQSTRNLSYLKQTRQMALKANEWEYGYNKSASLLSAVALEYSRLNDSENARATSEEAIKLDPRNANVWINKGNVLVGLGKYDDAISAYDEAINLSPSNANTWINKGIALNSAKKYDEAIQAYDIAIKLSPRKSQLYQLVEAWNHKGNSFQAKGENNSKNGSELMKVNYNESIKAHDEARVYYNEAIKAYDKAIILDPKSNPKSNISVIIGWAWNGIGVTWDDIGQDFNSSQHNYTEAIKAYDEAIKAYNNCTNITPSHPEAPVHRVNTFINKVIALNRLGKNNEAQQAYDEVIKLDPKYAWPETKQRILKDSMSTSKWCDLCD